jgi:hypothetical protein
MSKQCNAMNIVNKTREDEKENAMEEKRQSLFWKKDQLLMVMDELGLLMDAREMCNLQDGNPGLQGISPNREVI